MTYEEMGSVMDGAIQASILALVMVSIVLWLGLRSFRLITATLITLVVGLVLTASFSTLAVGHLNMISVAFAVLYIGLGVDYAIHLCLRYRELEQHKNHPEQSMVLSIKDIGPALVLSTLSTSIGFYAFVPTEFAGVSELGIIAGTGMFISLLVTLTLLPCLILKLSVLSQREIARSRFSLDLKIEKHRKSVRIATFALLFLSIWLLPKAAFDYDPINLRNPKSESVATVRELMQTQNFTPWTLDIITADSASMSQLSHELKNSPKVNRVVNIYRFIPDNQATKLKTLDTLKTIFDQVDRIPFAFDSISIEEQSKAIEDFGSLLTSKAYAVHPGLKSVGERLLSLASRVKEGESQEVVELLQQNLLSVLPYTISALKAGLSAQEVAYNSLPLPLKQRWVADQGSLRVQVFPKDPIENNRDMKAFVTEVQQIAPDATGDLAATVASGENGGRSI